MRINWTDEEGYPVLHIRTVQDPQFVEKYSIEVPDKLVSAYLELSEATEAAEVKLREAIKQAEE